jgi:hypothetical protein
LAQGTSKGNLHLGSVAPRAATTRAHLRQNFLIDGERAIHRGKIRLKAATAPMGRILPTSVIEEERASSARAMGDSLFVSQTL